MPVKQVHHQFGSSSVVCVSVRNVVDHGQAALLAVIAGLLVDPTPFPMLSSVAHLLEDDAFCCLSIPLLQCLCGGMLMQAC